MEEIQKLIAGFQRFRTRYYQRERHLFEPLVREGQAPKIMVIACCDSRVDPAIITDCDPGDLFVVRNVANLVPPYETGGSYHGTSAALEFAVRGLNVSHVIVLGHAQCGGIRALVEGPGGGNGGEFIAPWMTIAQDAVDKTQGGTREERLRGAEQAAIGISLANLRTFPWIRERLGAGTLQLHGWYFDINGGELLYCDSENGAFHALRDAADTGMGGAAS
jgi:carbonic anhydrase